jgi:hypothetical protein
LKHPLASTNLRNEHNTRSLTNGVEHRLFRWLAKAGKQGANGQKCRMLLLAFSS